MLNFGYILKVEPIRFPDGLDVVRERKELGMTLRNWKERNHQLRWERLKAEQI